MKLSSYGLRVPSSRHTRAGIKAEDARATTASNRRRSTGLALKYSRVPRSSRTASAGGSVGTAASRVTAGGTTGRYGQTRSGHRAGHGTRPGRCLGQDIAAVTLGCDLRVLRLAQRSGAHSPRLRGVAAGVGPGAAQRSPWPASAT